MTLQEAADQLAAQLRIQKEVIYGFVRNKGRLPSNIGELEAWGNDPSNNAYGIRRRDEQGGWHPIVPGPNPMRAGLPEGTADGTRGAWGITNEEDSALLPWQINQPFIPGAMGGFSGGGAPGMMSAQSAGSGRYSTKNGPKSLQDMQSELRTAGYPGPFDDQSVIEAYARTTQGPVSGANGQSSNGTPGSASGLGPLLDAAVYGNTRQDDRDQALNDARVKDILDRLMLAKNEDERAALQQELNQQLAADARYDSNRNSDLNRWLETQKMAQQGQQFEEGRYDTRLNNERNLYSTLGQNLLNASVTLGSRPEDYYKYNQMLSGGKDLLGQLFSDEAIPAFSAPTGEIRSGNIGNLLQQLGMPGIPGGWTTGGGAGNVPGMGAPGGALNPASEANWMQNRPSIFQFQPQPDIPFMPPVSDPRQQARAGASSVLKDYDAYIKGLGVPFLQQDDPRLIDYYKTRTGLDDNAARYVAQKSADYYKVNGVPIPENILAGHITEALGQQRSPNPGRAGAQTVERNYWNQVGQSGQSYLPAGDPRSIGAFGSAGGMSPGQARWGSGQAGEFAGSAGYPATGGDLGSIIERARRQPYTGYGDPSQGDSVMGPMLQSAASRRPRRDFAMAM